MNNSTSIRVRYIQNSASQKLNESHTGIFVAAEFDFDNHFGIGSKFSFQRASSKSKIQQILNIDIDLRNSMVVLDFNSFKCLKQRIKKPPYQIRIPLVCIFYKIWKFQPSFLRLNLGLKAINFHSTRTREFKPRKSTPASKTWILNPPLSKNRILKPTLKWLSKLNPATKKPLY